MFICPNYKAISSVQWNTHVLRAWPAWWTPLAVPPGMPLGVRYLAQGHFRYDHLTLWIEQTTFESQAQICDHQAMAVPLWMHLLMWNCFKRTFSIQFFLGEQFVGLFLGAEKSSVLYWLHTVYPEETDRHGGSMQALFLIVITIL